MNQPDVTLTDYGLALLCAYIVVRLWQGPGFGPLRRWLLWFFAAAGAAPLFGGTVHGFFEYPGTPAFEILWPATLISIGVAAVAAWGLGARLWLRDGMARGVIGLATLVFIGYAAMVLLGFQEFRIAVLHYLPAAAFLLLAVVVTRVRRPDPGLTATALGLVLTFVAAGVQQSEIGLHSEYFDHNALYHLIQAIGLILIWRGIVAYGQARSR